MKAYLDEFAPPLCPSCNAPLPRERRPGRSDDTDIVICVNPNCPEFRRRKTFPRAFVELTDAD